MSSWVERLTALVQQFAPDLASDSQAFAMILGWANRESSGNNAAISSAHEAGWFQISPAEAKQFGYGIAQITADEGYSVQSGVDLIRRYGAVASSLGFAPDPNDDLYWRIVKLIHTVGAGGTRQLLTAADTAGLPRTWDGIEQVAVDLPGRTHWVSLVDDVFDQGYKLAEGVPAFLAPFRGDGDTTLDDSDPGASRSDGLDPLAPKKDEC